MIRLPVKFESILRDDELQYSPLILRVDRDLKRFDFLRRFNSAQAAGCLAVICSPPGTGKTTAAYAASVLLKDHFSPVTSVAPAMSVPLSELPRWFSEKLPPPSSKCQIVLIDGRESTDDAQGLRDTMGALNSVVRGRPDLLFVWPTTDDEWSSRLVDQARKFGSQSLCPDQAVFAVDGPARDQWLEGARLMMEQLGSSWDEFGVNEASARSIAETKATLGDFLTAVNSLRIEQETLAADATGLPDLVFVVSSHSRVVSDVARLRNPQNYRLRTDELVSSAPRKSVGKFWTERGAAQRANLAWVSGLFRAKLLSLTPSTVAHACYVYAQESSPLKAAARTAGFRGSLGTGANSYNTTDLGRFIAGSPVPEVASSNKGKTTQKTLAAYDAIQTLSSRRHLEINRAILEFASAASGLFSMEDVEFEVSLGDDAIVDAIAPVGDLRRHFEFHHLSGDRCNPNRIATYIMDKLQTYAVEYNLIER